MAPGPEDGLGLRYDAYYFAHSCGRPYLRDEEWLTFFGRIADLICSEIQPRSVLDVGCAMGFLVEALRDRGVDAWGLDVSDYALEQVREDIEPYVWRASITEPLARDYDLIVAIEVLEHLAAPDGELALDNICAHAGDVVFSSSPVDLSEMTHLNVQPPEYWATQFARRGFLRDLDFIGTTITPWAVRFCRRQEPISRTVSGYERRLWATEWQRHEIHAKASELEARVAELRTEVERASAEHERLSRVAENEGSRHRALAGRVEELELKIGKLAGALRAARGAEARLAALEQTKTLRYTARIRRAWALTRRRIWGRDTALNVAAATRGGGVSGSDYPELAALLTRKHVALFARTSDPVVAVATAATRTQVVVSDSALVTELLDRLEQHGVREKVDLHVRAYDAALRELPPGTFEAVVIESDPQGEDVPSLLDRSLGLLAPAGVVAWLGDGGFRNVAVERGLRVEDRGAATVARR